MEVVLETLIGIALLCLTYSLWKMLDKLDYIQNLVELYGENAWKHFREEEQRRYFKEREKERNGRL